MKKLSVIVFFLLCAMFSKAQDTLYKRNKEVQVVKIHEIGLDEVKYKLPGYEDGPMISIAKDDLYKIVFANGTTQILAQEMNNPQNYSDQRKNAVKMDFISPLRNNLSFIYERSLKPGRSIEFNVGVIGVGITADDYDDASGSFIRVGYKFIRTPDYYFRGMRYAHILKGGYVRPDVIFGMYSFDRYSDVNQSDIRDKITYGGLQLSLGKQWVYDDLFLVDLFFGLGYTFSSLERDEDVYDYTVQYGVVGGGDNAFSVSGGFRIGFLIK